MTKRNFFLLSGVVIAFLVLIIIIFWWVQYGNEQKVQGKLVFAKTYDLGHLVNRIEIITPSEVIKIKQKDSYWLLENQDGYYADFNLMHQLLSSFNESLYSVKLPYDKQVWEQKRLNNPEKTKDNAGVLIRTYQDEAMLDEIIIGAKTDDNTYFFARDPHDDDMWLINGNFVLPRSSEGWILNPLLEIPDTVVESIESENKKIARLNKLSGFFDEKGFFVQARSLLMVLRELEAIKVLNAKTFNEKIPAQIIPERIIVTIEYGLQFILDLYKVENRTFVQIGFNKVSLSTPGVSDYINENKFLYDDWFFELESGQAHVLHQFISK